MVQIIRFLPHPSASAFAGVLSGLFQFFKVLLIFFFTFYHTISERIEPFDGKLVSGAAAGSEENYCTRAGSPVPSSDRTASCLSPLSGRCMDRKKNRSALVDIFYVSGTLRGTCRHELRFSRADIRQPADRKFQRNHRYGAHLF